MFLDQDVKTFESEDFGSQNLEIKNVNILGPCPWMLKASIPKKSKSKILTSHDPKFEVFRRPNLEFEGSNILGPCPWIVKASIWMFLDPQTSKPGGHPKSKLLASSQPDR